MTKKFNSAARVHALLVQARAQGPEQSTAQAWAQVFGMQFSRNPAGFAEVARRLALVSEELEDAYRQMKATEHSPDIYERTSNHARSAIGLEALNAGWKQVKTNLDGDVLTILMFCAEILPDEDLRVPDDQRKRLLELLKQLKESVADEAIPHELRSFILSQVEILERALAEFSIVGGKAFDRAVGEVLVRYPEYGNILTRHQGAQQLTLLDRAWSQVLTWSTRLNALRNVLQAGRGFLGLLGPGDPSPQ